MENQDLQWLARAFAALANENRLLMFRHLRAKESECGARDEGCSYSDHCCNVGELAANLEVTQATVSHHLKELSRTELVEAKRQGRFIHVSVNRPAVERLEEFLHSGITVSTLLS